MNKFFEYLLIIIWVIAFSYFEVFGIYHSFSRHGLANGAVSFFVPPYAWYNAAEYWWHDDFAGVDWDKRTEYDLQACFVLLNSSFQQDTELTMNLGRLIDEYSKALNRYPKEKIDILKDGCKAYINWSESWLMDIRNAAQRVANGEDLNFKISDKTKRYEYELVKYPGTEESIIPINKLMNERFGEIPIKGKDEYTIEEREEIKEAVGTLDIVINYYRSKSESIYEDIFNEKFN